MSTTPQPSILLIQSDADAVRRLRRAVGATGYRGIVRVLRGAEEARSYFRQPPSNIPSLIVCGLDFDGISGFDVLSSARGQPQLTAVPFVFLASLPRTEDVDRARALHVPDPMAMPSDDGELVRALGRLLALVDPATAAGGASRLKEIRVGSSSESADISARKRYRVRVGSAWHEGAFRKYWFGWNFEDFGASGIQLNLIDEVYEIRSPDVRPVRIGPGLPPRRPA